jgi:hypothetical protein
MSNILKIICAFVLSLQFGIFAYLIKIDREVHSLIFEEVIE